MACRSPSEFYPSVTILAFLITIPRVLEFAPNRCGSHATKASPTVGPFTDLRRGCEEKPAHGEHLDFDKIMLEIAAIRKRAASPTKN